MFFQYHVDLSLDFTQVHGMRLFDKNVEMADLFIHPRLKMAKMRSKWPFWMVNGELPCRFWVLFFQNHGDLYLDFTPVHWMRLFDKNVEMVAVFVHLGPINGHFLVKNGPKMVKNGQMFSFFSMVLLVLSTTDQLCFTESFKMHLSRSYYILGPGKT